VPTTLNITWKIPSKLFLITHPRVLMKQEDQPQVKTLTVNEIETPKSKEPEKALEDEFKDLHLNIPVLEVLAHAPMYNAILDKYVKSLELGKNRSAFIQSEMLKKMKDLRLSILPCRLGDSKPFDTLADLGSCMNLIPLYLFKTQKFRLLEETKNVLGLADGTKSYPVGIMRNVEVYVGKLKLLDDFYVIDIEKDPTCPLLVGRGFLAIVSAVIDYKKSKIAVGEGITMLIFRVKEIVIEDMIEKKIDWNKPPMEGDGAWQNRIELIDPDGEKFDRVFQSIPITRKLYEKEKPSDIIDLEHFYDS
ncbi:hypothetical protein Tco_1048402, partial [Tanacetum coccineum]